MAKKAADKPKFADKANRKAMLVRECPTCGKFHHPRSAACPNCGHQYPKTKSVRKKLTKKAVKQRPAAAAAARSGANPLDAGIQLVAACRGDVAAARRVLDTIDSIRKL